MKTFLKSVALAGLVSGAAAADKIAITGGTAFTMNGDERIENATILVDGGKIEAVRSGGSVPAGYRVIDASGKWVTPGLMASGTQLGLVEVSLSGGIVDASATAKAKDPVTIDVTWAINPDSTLIPITRIEGITRAATGMQSTGDVWLGQGAVIHLGDGYDLTVRDRAFIGLNMTGSSADANGGSRAVIWRDVITALEKAEPQPAMADDDKDEKAKEKKPDPVKDTLARLFSGEATLVVAAHRAADIRNVIKLKSRFDINIALMGGAEAWREAAALAGAGIPVILNALDNLPGSFETLGATQANAARLHAAGVTIALVGRGTHNARLMPQYAGNAVANGLPWSAAMAAMTTGPAEIFGIADSYGTLAEGMDADIVVWSGDPIELDTAAEHVMIVGEEIDLVSRQTKLRDRYKELSRSPAFR